MKLLYELMLVGLAGAVGTITRYASGHFTTWLFGNGFPLGTLFVNIIGSFLFGLFAGHFSTGRIPLEWKVLLLTGFLGGFTTFSAFAAENHHFIETKQWTLFALNIIGQNLFGILAVLFGLYLANNMR
ncbi:MAG: fluoride efflux transporter CrcB [Thermoguttaceae bacterium]